MADKNDVLQSIQSKIESLSPTDVCALFFILIERNAIAEGALSLDSKAEHIESTLARFFRLSDIVGYLGENRFAVFITGKPTEDVIHEKAETLSSPGWLPTDIAGKERLKSSAGVYVFRAKEDTFEDVLERARDSLELARKDTEKHFHIYMAAQTSTMYFRPHSDSMSSQTLMGYIDEGVRVFKVDSDVQTIYVSPDYYSRLGGAKQIAIHPMDAEQLDMDIMEVAESGRQREGSYRLENDSGGWVNCRITLLRLLVSGESAFVLEISHDIAGLEYLKSQYDEKEQWLNFLASRVDHQLWEVDIKERVFRTLYEQNMLDSRRQVYTNFPDSIVETGRIHRDSVDAFLKFANEMLNGKAEGTINVIAQYRQTQCYGWISMSYYMLYDSSGHPEKAIGFNENISYVTLQHSRFMQRRNVPSTLYPHLYCYIQANLTMDYIEKLILEGHEMIRLTRFKSYSQVVSKSSSRIFSPEVGERLVGEFNRDRLIEAYQHGKQWFYNRFQVIDNSGEIQWVSAGANLLLDEETRDICLFVYISLRKDQHKWEEEIGYNYTANEAGGLYPEKAALAMIEKRLEEGEKTLCAVALISFEGLEDIYEGKDAEEEIRRRNDIATALHVFLDTDCILWWNNSESIFAFFPDMTSKISLKRRIENAFFFTRISLGAFEDVKYMRFIAGVACAGFGSADFEKMKFDVENLCEVNNSEPADAVLFADEDYDWTEILIRRIKPEDLPVDRPELMLPMTEEDKDIAISCLALMLNADTKGSSIDAVLARLGLYYQADRVYVLALTEQRQTLTMLNEWVGKGKYSIQNSISGKKVSRFPVIARYAQEPRPLVLSADDVFSTSSMVVGENPWQYVIFPMGSKDDADFIFCIENPRQHLDRMALVKTLLPHLSREEKRFFPLKNLPEQLQQLQRLYSLHNTKEYEKVIYHMDSDHCSSMGAAAVDIPDFARIKEERGYEYAANLLLRISETLTITFGQRLIFRTREEEFIILSTDITYRVFINQCARVKRMIGRRYSKLFRMGVTWSDGIFNGADLVNKAKSIMKCVTSSSTPILQLYDSEENARVEALEEEAPQEVEARRFIIFLQPKVDMRSGELMGAEALIRVMDSEGNLVPHVPIIEQMEKEGTIHQMDFFVFDRVLHTLSDWLGKGYDCKMISSNFSRKTLFSTTALASVLAIMSRYPEVPQDLVELEVTETAGSFENNTFSELINRFGEYGLMFSLDDFGSSYSNMSMLSDLHFHSVKLDRSMVRNITINSVARMLVKDIASICESCGMLCIAEGVETQAQADVLLENGCYCAQGFFYGRPMTVEEFERKYFQSESE